MQLSVTVIAIAFCVFHNGTRLFLRKHTELMWVALIVVVVTMLAMACCESVRRNYPTNFIFLGLFTLAESFMLATMTSVVPGNTVSPWEDMLTSRISNATSFLRRCF